MVKKSCNKCDSNPFNIEKLILDLFDKKKKKKKNKSKNKSKSKSNKDKSKRIRKKTKRKNNKKSVANMPARYSYYM